MSQLWMMPSSRSAIGPSRLMRTRGMATSIAGSPANASVTSLNPSVRESIPTDTVTKIVLFI